MPSRISVPARSVALKAFLFAVLVLGGWLGESPACAQETQPAEGVPVMRVEIQGLLAVGELYVRRALKTREGQPFSRQQVEEDVRELLRTRKFLAAFATTRLEDSQAVVTYHVQEKPTITSVEIIGAKQLKERDLYELAPAAGSVLDGYEVNRAREDILQRYKEKGYFYATVELDEPALTAENRVIYRIVEGPRVRVRHIRFEGNRAFSARRLGGNVQTKTYIWIFRTGALDEEQAGRDALAVQNFYRDEGYLDARAGYRLDFHPVNRADVDVAFVIEEGTRYRVQEIEIQGNEQLSTESIQGELNMAPGSFARDETLKRDVRVIEDMYGQRGFVGTRVTPRYDYLEEPGVVRLVHTVTEAAQVRVGKIVIRGNVQTRDEVVRRELRFYPGDYWDTVEARRAEQRLRETGLFRQDSVQILPREEVEGFRDALVQVEETETTQFIVGFGVSTDNGLVGNISIDNRNFDITDWPQTWGEFLRGRAFRGDGQRLLIQFEPGTEVSRFRITFTEPYLFDREIRYDNSFYLFARERDGYDESRLGLSFTLTKRFYGGWLDRWAIEGSTRLESVRVSDVDTFAADDIQDAEGTEGLLGIRGALVRDTTDSRVFPTEGYRVSFSYEQV
ncbi:MAG: POTRA domain-containing protein, partial [Planctomycetota bacterium]